MIGLVTSHSCYGPCITHSDSTTCTGDLLRAEAAKPDSPLGAQLQEIMREGRLVPDDITVSVLQVSPPCL